VDVDRQPATKDITGSDGSNVERKVAELEALVKLICD